MQTALVLFLCVGISVYRVVVEASLVNFQPYGWIIVSVSSASLNLLFIFIMSSVYTWVAQRLTEWECPRTRNQFDNQYAVKMFSFQFVNYFSAPFYTAFFRGKFNGPPPTTDPSQFDFSNGTYWQ